MKSTKFQRAGLILAAIASLGILAGTTTAQTIVATDNADLYPGNPDHNWSVNNGGFGFGAWTPISDVSGGGTFMEGVGVNNRQVEGNYSFALYSGSGAFDISRPLTTSLASGTFSIITRFDLAGSGPNVINLRTGNNVSNLGAGELLSFGIVNNNQLSYTDSSGLHTIASGEARGVVWDWTINFNATAGIYSLLVAAPVGQPGGGFSTSVSGNLDASGTTVGSFGAINSNTGGNQNLIFDVPTFTVPEPSTFALLGLGAAGLFAFRRRNA